MNFYQLVFHEKKFENICKKGKFWGNYPLIVTLSGQLYSFNYIFKSRLYMPQIYRVAKKSKTV